MQNAYKRLTLTTILILGSYSSKLMAIDKQSLIERFRLVGVITHQQDKNQDIAVIRDDTKNSSFMVKKGDAFGNNSSLQVFSITDGEVILVPKTTMNNKQQVDDSQVIHLTHQTGNSQNSESSPYQSEFAETDSYTEALPDFSKYLRPTTTEQLDTYDNSYRQQDFQGRTNEVIYIPGDSITEPDSSENPTNEEVLQRVNKRLQEIMAENLEADSQGNEDDNKQDEQVQIYDDYEQYEYYEDEYDQESPESLDYDQN